MESDIRILDTYNDMMSPDSEILRCDNRLLKSDTGWKWTDNDRMESDSKILSGDTEILSSYIDWMECSGSFLRSDIDLESSRSSLETTDKSLLPTDGCFKTEKETQWQMTDKKRGFQLKKLKVEQDRRFA